MSNETTDGQEAQELVGTNMGRPLSSEERTKVMAEAEKIKVETDNVRALASVTLKKAMTEALQAEALLAKTKLETLLAEVNLRIQQANETGTQIALAQTQRLEELQLAGDLYHQLYQFNEVVTEESVHHCIERLSYWHRTRPGCKIEIIFNSPGGAVIDSLRLFDYIQQLKRDGHHIETNTLGMAASMAGILLQAGTHRVMAKEAWVLIHEISAGAFGKTPEMEDELKFLKRVQKRILHIFREGMERAHKDNPRICTDPMTVKRLEKAWSRKDWWLSSDECLKYGLVDEVR